MKPHYPADGSSFEIGQPLSNASYPILEAKIPQSKEIEAI